MPNHHLSNQSFAGCQPAVYHGKIVCNTYFCTNKHMMKYKTGETVLLLDTTFKPVCSAIIRNVNEASIKYEVEFVHPGITEAQKIWVPQERLVVLPVTNRK